MRNILAVSRRKRKLEVVARMVYSVEDLKKPCVVCGKIPKKIVKGICSSCYIRDYFKSYIRLKNRTKEYYKRYRENCGWYKSYIREYNRKYRIKNREIYLAHRAVELALKNKILFRMPCEICGGKNVHAHHDDYKHKLIVRWLCPKHHSEAHKNLKNKVSVLSQF